MWVKICGNTRLEDCLQAAELGADAVGFVFATGKRTVTAAQVAAITVHLPASLEKIGVFTTRDADTLIQITRDAGLTGVQLHSTPDRALLERLATDTSCTLIQVLHWQLDQPAHLQQAALTAQVDALNSWGLVHRVLVDSQTATASGGTGIPFPWAAAAPLVQRSTLPVIAAGGLRPETVAGAIATLCPWGVDVSSGVESAPGIKHATKLRGFLAAAHL